MSTHRVGIGLVLVLLAAGPVAADQEKKTDADKAPKELTVVDYDSATQGAVQVMTKREKPADWFDVLKDGKRAFEGNPKLLNNTLEFAPGTYVVVVNRTERKVTIEAGKKTVLWTGELVVEGKPESAFWYPVLDKDRKVAANPPLLNRSLPLFPGEYQVLVYESVTTGAHDKGRAEVKPGQTTKVKH